MKVKLNKNAFLTIELIISLSLISILIYGVSNINFINSNFFLKQYFNINLSNQLYPEYIKDSNDLYQKCNIFCFEINKDENYISYLDKYIILKSNNIQGKKYELDINKLINVNGGENIDFEVDRWLNNEYYEFHEYEQVPGENIVKSKILNNKLFVFYNDPPRSKIFNINNEGKIDLANTLLVKVDNKEIPINDVEIKKEYTNGKNYFFFALATSTNQIAIFEFNNNFNYIKSVNLKNVNPNGSYPEGYKILYFKNRLYATTRETSGFEFHIFNATNSENISEINNGYEINRTINQMIARNYSVQGINRTLIFNASDSNLKEYSIFDVTDDLFNEISYLNLPGNQDGLSLDILNDIVYFGRQSNTSGPEIYEIKNNTSFSSSSVEKIIDINTSIIQLKKYDNLLFIGTTKSNEEFQIFDLNSYSIKNKYRFNRLIKDGILPFKNKIILINQSNTADKIEVLKI